MRAIKQRLCAFHLEPSVRPEYADQPRIAVNSFPTDPDCRLTRDQLAVSLSAAGYPISSATLATRVSRGEGPPHAIWGSRVYYRWGDALADTLDELKLPVFTFGGVGDGLPDGVGRYLKPLTGRLLVIPTDNDAPGRKHAQEKAKLAHASGIEHIRIFDPREEWPECPEGGDVTDWFEKGGGTREKLLEIVDTLPDWQPSADGTASEAFDSFDSFDSTEEPNGKTGESGSGTWADPDFSILDDRRGTLPEFPIDVFSPKCQAWLKPAAAGAGAMVDHVAVPLLGTVSALIGTARQVQATRSWRTPLTTWTTVVGLSGTNKTPGLDVGTRSRSSKALPIIRKR
jgi:hypothetical protein